MDATRGNDGVIDLRLLTDAERREHDRLREISNSSIKSEKFTELGLKWQVRTCWRSFTLLGLCTAWGLYEVFALALRTPDLPDGSMPAIVWVLLGSMVPAAVVIVMVWVRELRAGLARLVPDYLTTLNLHHRQLKIQPPSEPSGSPSYTYPVTDGMYDPHLYASRGGRETYNRMKTLGIDDYSTYKNNVLEAE